MERMKRSVDVGKLSQLKEKELRQCVRNILDKCMPGGGYALGSGNSITNYIPVRKLSYYAGRMQIIFAWLVSSTRMIMNNADRTCICFYCRCKNFPRVYQ